MDPSIDKGKFVKNKYLQKAENECFFRNTMMS